MEKAKQKLSVQGVPARAWNKTVTPYRISGTVSVQRGCFAFMFTNIGDTVAKVDDMLIFPSATPLTALGDSRSLGAHTLDLYKGGPIKIEFIAGAGVNPLVEIVQLYYTDID